MSGPDGSASQCNSHGRPSLTRHCASEVIKPKEFSGSSVRRKRSQDELPKPLPQSIAINPYPSTCSTSTSTSPANEPETFVPVQILRRSSLPLSFVDSACSLPSRPLSRLFSARPDLLGALQSDSLGLEPTVLIVASLADERLYAIENVASSRDTYALCRLASWLTKRDIEVLDHVKGAKECLKADRGAKRRMTMMQLGSEKSDWWHGAAISAVSIYPLAKKRRICGPILKMGMPSPRLEAEESKDPIDLFAKQPSFASLQDGKGQEIKREASPSPSSLVEDPKSTLSFDELKNNLIHQYLDSLYLSRTSLAYFAKGPLSRLRGAASGTGCVLSLFNLTEFLRSAMLTPSLLEKKYKETLPATIRDVYAFDINDDEDDANLSTSNKVKQQENRQKKKKRKGNSLKPAKNGLFPDEEEVIRKWWLSSDKILATENCNSSSLSPFKSKVEAMKARVAALRLREISGQIIIALEILAIERSSAFTDEVRKEDVVGQDNVVSNKGGQAETNCKQRRTKKKQDTSLILDLLVDKLCIWRSIELQDLSFKNSSRSEDSVLHSEASKTSSRNVSGNTDLLFDFCVEVVVPFYMHRLPEVASSLSSKLGGPKAPISDRRPLKSSAMSTSGTQNPARPGDPAIRQVQVNQRRKIARVASDTSNRYSHPQHPGIGYRSGSAAGNGTGGSVRSRESSNSGPRRIATLSRSATDTALPMLKCEAENEENELSLASIPPSRRARGAGRDLISSRRQALSQCKRLSQREVDFNAMTKGKVNVLGMATGASASAATGANIKQSGKGSSEVMEYEKKLQKSKNIEAMDAQLQDAISAIKKPDRRAVVGKEFEEAVERQGVLKAKGKIAARNGVGKGREKLPPQHSRGLQQTVQVTATPKHPRASAMMMMQDRHSFGEGQYITTRDHHIQSSIPISFSSAQARVNDRSEYQIQNPGQTQDQSQDYFADEYGFIPSSAVRPSISMVTSQPSISPLQTVSKIIMADGRHNCIPTDVTFNNKYLNDAKNLNSTPKPISSLPPILSLHSSTVNAALGSETPSRHPNTKRFDPFNHTHISEDRLFATIATADSAICPDTPASLSKRQSSAATTNTINNNINDEAINPLDTVAAATPVANRVAILSTRRDNGNARSLLPAVRRGSTYPKDVPGEHADGYINKAIASDRNVEAGEEDDDVCAETPSGPGRKRLRKQQGQQRYKGNDEEDNTADVLATQMKGQEWDITGNLKTGVIDGKSRKTTKTTFSSTKSNGNANAKVRSRARAMAVVIPGTKSSNSSSSPSASSSSLSLHSSPPSSSPPAAAAAATGVQPPTGSKVVPLSTPKTSKTVAIAHPVETQQKSAIVSSPLHGEENIYRVLGWE